MAEAAAGSAKLPAAPGGAPEEALIGESVWGAIQALKKRGRGKKQVARDLGLDVHRAFLEGRASEVGARRPGLPKDRLRGMVRGRTHSAAAVE